MSVLLLVLVLTGGIDEDLREDIRFGWQSAAGDAVARGLDVAVAWPALLATDAAFGLAGDAKLRQVSCQALASWVGANGAMLAMRVVVRRPRPEQDEVNWWESSFPSGHVNNYCAMATVYAVRYPEFGWVLVAGGVLVGLSRIYLGEHYPSDVLAGAALGVGMGALTVALWPRANAIRLRAGRHEFVPVLAGPDESGRMLRVGVGVGL